jgi:hypothetical protein
MNPLAPQPIPNVLQPEYGQTIICAKCKLEVGDNGDEIVRAARSTYHADCFSCSECNMKLKRAAFRVDNAGRLRCLADCTGEKVARDKSGILKSLNTIDVPRRLRKMEAEVE